MVQRLGRGIALLLHDRGTSRWLVVSSTPRPHFTPGERPGTHFKGGLVGPRAGLDRCGKSRPHRNSIPDRPARSQSLYRLSYRAHRVLLYKYTFPSTSNEMRLNDYYGGEIAYFITNIIYNSCYSYCCDY